MGLLVYFDTTENDTPHVDLSTAAAQHAQSAPSSYLPFMLVSLRPIFSTDELTIDRHKCPINLSKPLETILQSLGHVMGLHKLRFSIHQHINLHPNTVSRMVRRDILEAPDYWAEAVAHKYQLLLQTI
jgi:hypothetical protein